MITSVKRLGAIAAAAALTLAAAQAQAGWGGHRGHGSSGGSGGSYGSYGSSGGYYSYGSWGSSGGSSGGSWGYSGYGSSGGYHSYGSWGSSGGSSGGSWGGYTDHGDAHYAPAAPQDSMPAPPAPNAPARGADGAAPADGAVPGGATPPPAPPGAAGPGGSSTQYRASDTNALLTVNVPTEAKVFINGTATSSRGDLRQYISRGLRNDARYNYEVRAEITRDGKTVSDVKTVQLGAGETANLAFNLASVEPTQAQASVKTTLIVHVPADAKVFLAGQETKAGGPVRQFTTTRLTSGSQWASYPVRVVVTRDGKTVSKEESVSLKAGDSREIEFNFDAPQSIGKVARATR